LAGPIKGGHDKEEVEPCTHKLFGTPPPNLTSQVLPSPIGGTLNPRIVAELDVLQAEIGALKRFQAETAVEIDALLPSILDHAFDGGI
jgi:hypothetical protein